MASEVTSHNHHKCRSRCSMPQIDLEDYPSLFAYLNMRAISVSEHTYPANWLKPKQCPDEVRPTRRLELVMKKPLLISLGLWILDGNHRWARALQIHEAHPVRCFQVGCGFDEACGYLLQFPNAKRKDFVGTEANQHTT